MRARATIRSLLVATCILASARSLAASQGKCNGITIRQDSRGPAISLLAHQPKFPFTLAQRLKHLGTGKAITPEEVESMPDTELCLASTDLKTFRSSAKHRAEIRKEYYSFIAEENKAREERIKDELRKIGAKPDDKAQNNGAQNSGNNSQNAKQGSDKGKQNQTAAQTRLHRFARATKNFFAVLAAHLRHPTSKDKFGLVVFLLILLCLYIIYKHIKDPDPTIPSIRGHGPPGPKRYLVPIPGRAAQTDGFRSNNRLAEKPRSSAKVRQENTTGRNVRTKINNAIAQVKIRYGRKKTVIEFPAINPPPSPVVITAQSIPTEVKTDDKSNGQENGTKTAGNSRRRRKEKRQQTRQETLRKAS